MEALLVDQVSDEEANDVGHAAWARREAARSRQIAIGRNRPEYRRYIAEVPRERRTPSQPRTPDPRERVSKRQFDRELSNWRRQLHVYDGQSSTPASSDSGSRAPLSPAEPSLPIARAGATPDGKLRAATPSTVDGKRGGSVPIQLASVLELPDSTPSTATGSGCTPATPATMWSVCEQPMAFQMTPSSGHWGPQASFFGVTMMPMDENMPMMDTSMMTSPAMMVRPWACSLPLQPVVKKALVFEAAQDDIGDVFGCPDANCDVPEAAAKAVLDEDDDISDEDGGAASVIPREEDEHEDDEEESPESPRTPTRRPARAGIGTSSAKIGSFTPCFNPRARSPPASVATPKTWMVDTPSPERFYQAPVRLGGRQPLMAALGPLMQQGPRMPAPPILLGGFGAASHSAAPAIEGLRAGAPVSARGADGWSPATVHAIRPDGLVEVVWPAGRGGAWSVTPLSPEDVRPAVIGLPLPMSVAEASCSSNAGAYFPGGM